MAKRKKSYVPRELPARLQGQQRCEAMSPSTQMAQVCVEAGKFGWSAWLVHGGKRIAPISIGRAKSVDDAMRAARQNVARIRAGRRRPPR